MRIAVFTTHPVQYQAPWFRAMAQAPGVELQVYFSYLPAAAEQGVGFGIAFEWDIPILEGYPWRVLPGAKVPRWMPRFMQRPVRKVGEVLQLNRPDVAIVMGWQEVSLLQALYACRRASVPVLIRGESNGLRQRTRIVRRLHAALLGFCDGFLAIGKANENFYRALGVSEGRIWTAPYVVDNERFRDQAEKMGNSREDIRREWGIAPGTFCLCFVGKLEPKKRVMDVLTAFDVASKSGPPKHLLVVGSGEQMAAAKTFAGERALRVTFAGFLNQTQIPSAYVAADALVLASDFGETWGLVVNEAMACGRPALVSNRAGCWPDLVRNGETGAVFEFGNVRQLADLMNEWAASPAMVHRMGRAAQELVRGDYSIARASAETLEAVRTLTGAR